MAEHYAKKIGKRIDPFNIINTLFLGLWGIIIVYPFYNSVLISLVSQKDYTLTPFMLFPKHITFMAYQYIFESPMLLNGFKSTLIILIFGIPYNMLLSILIAYGLSRNKFPGKKLITYFIVFTMFFGGGMIPFYLLVRSLGLMGSLASVILVYGINTFYMLIMKSYFETIPASIEESAKMDGANELVILFKIVLPLSLPIIATFMLFYTVDRWNEWFNALLLISDGHKWPLQAVLRSIISSVDLIGSNSTTYNSLRSNVFTDGVKMAATIVTIIPIMAVYPFVQKYFVKGIMLGAVKA